MNANILKFVTSRKIPLSLSRFLSVSPSHTSSVSDKHVSISENANTKTATLVLQKPPVNSLSLELLQQITSAIKELEARKNVKGVIISSGCPNVFCAGLDIMEMYQFQESRFRLFWKAFQETWKTLYLTPLITMAEINGHAPAAGCMLALSCDYKIMLNSNVKIGLNETMLGIGAPKWLQQIYIDTLGFRRAETALTLGTLFTPEQALALNLVDDLASNSQELHSKIHQQMDVWLQIPEKARQVTKMNLRENHVKKMLSYEAEELEYIVKSIEKEETQVALGQYVQKLKKNK